MTTHTPRCKPGTEGRSFSNENGVPYALLAGRPSSIGLSLLPSRLPRCDRDGLSILNLDLPDLSKAPLAESRRAIASGLRASELLPSITSLLVFMAAGAVLSGSTGCVLARTGVLATDWLTLFPSPAMHYRFMEDCWASEVLRRGSKLRTLIRSLRGFERNGDISTSLPKGSSNRALN
jgi:hypothetical protein